MGLKHKLAVKEEPIVEKRMNQRLVGKFIYLTPSQLDIAYLMSIISQFAQDPREPRLQAVNRVLDYWKGSPGKGMLSKKNGTLVLEPNSDADHAGFLVD